LSRFTQLFQLPWNPIESELPSLWGRGWPARWLGIIAVALLLPASNPLPDARPFAP
jgi:hypothetical protein